MIELFGKKEAFCTVCKKSISHRNKPKSSWKIEGPLCGNCYVDLMKEHFKKNDDDKCFLCGTEPGSFNLWKPKKEWDIHGWLCKPCFDKKEKLDEESKKYCSLCGNKLGFFCYSPKKEWGMQGQLCKNCWNVNKNKQREDLDDAKKF